MSHGWAPEVVKFTGALAIGGAAAGSRAGPTRDPTEAAGTLRVRLIPRVARAPEGGASESDGPGEAGERRGDRIFPRLPPAFGS